MKITIKNLQKRIPINPKRIKLAILKVLSLEGIKKSGEINVYFVNNKKIKELNLKFLKKDCATDVLSFDISKNKEEILADIVVSTDKAFYNAGVFGTSPLYELNLYVIHGLLHLLGCDDKTAKQRKIIEKRATYILNTLNKIICPYTRPSP